MMIWAKKCSSSTGRKQRHMRYLGHCAESISTRDTRFSMNRSGGASCAPYDSNINPLLTVLIYHCGSVRYRVLVRPVHRWSRLDNSVSQRCHGPFWLACVSRRSDLHPFTPLGASTLLVSPPRPHCEGYIHFAADLGRQSISQEPADALRAKSPGDYRVARSSRNARKDAAHERSLSFAFVRSLYDSNVPSEAPSYTSPPAHTFQFGQRPIRVDRLISAHAVTVPLIRISCRLPQDALVLCGTRRIQRPSPPKDK